MGVRVCACVCVSVCMLICVYLVLCIFRELYGTQLSTLSFERRCEDWFALLEKMESDLATGVSPTQPAIREQLTLHQVT